MKTKLIIALLTFFSLTMGYSKEKINFNFKKNTTEILSLKKNPNEKVTEIKAVNCYTFAMLAMAAMEDIAGCLSSEEYNSGYHMYYGMCRILTA